MFVFKYQRESEPFFGAKFIGGFVQVINGLLDIFLSPFGYVSDL